LRSLKGVEVKEVQQNKASEPDEEAIDLGDDNKRK
jgi:hypothetical protein